jgi:PPM family protein phosphatase
MRPTVVPVAPAGVHIDVAALSHTGLVREQNEDAYLVFRVGRYLERIASNVPEAELPSHDEESGLLMIVADGMGGHQAGEVASHGALVSMLQLIAASPRWALKLSDPATREREIAELRQRMREYIAGVHDAIRQRARQDATLSGMGTTFTAAYAVGGDVFVLHVGDSKAYLMRGGTIEKITRDHTLAQEYADLGMIAQDDVPTHRMHHVLTRAIGGPDDELEGDIYHVEATSGDQVVLCSDGLTDMSGEDEIARVLAAHGRSEDACRALVELSLARGGRDNVTVIVARMP